MSWQWPIWKPLSRFIEKNLIPSPARERGFLFKKDNFPAVHFEFQNSFAAA
jgi:hypothetical protein